MKKTIAALLGASLAIAFTACGSPAEPAPEQETPTPTLCIQATYSPPAPTPAVQPAEAPAAVEYLDDELVRIDEHIPGIAVELRYATTENFTGEVIYGFTDAYLRYSSVLKLKTVQEELNALGYGLVIWDGYRPQEAQFALWEAAPDPRYVANPNTGHSSHSNGGTVDVGLVRLDGSPLELPSDFDEFEANADRDYSDVSDEARENALILQNTMEKHGFAGYFGEWWHYSDTDEYSFDDVDGLLLPESRDEAWTPDCDEYISLRTAPRYEAEAICRIPLGAELKRVGWLGEFVHVVYENLHGYVAAGYIRPA